MKIFMSYLASNVHFYQGKWICSVHPKNLWLIMKNCHCTIPENCHKGKHQRRVTEQCQWQQLHLLKGHQILFQPYNNKLAIKLVISIAHTLKFPILSCKLNTVINKVQEVYSNAIFWPSAPPAVAMYNASSRVIGL